MYTHDYIIIGQGIAGSAIVQRLIESNTSFFVIDAQDNNQASRIASGIWNPVTLKRMKKSWLADEMLEELLPFYDNAQSLFGDKFIENIKVNRLFASADETNEWVEISDRPKFEGLINPSIFPNKNSSIKSPFGFGEVEKSGRIITETWIDAVKKWLLKNNLLLEQQFNFENLTINQNSVEYLDIKSRGIIFCEGMHAAFNNPYFKHIPFLITKGEVLEIECPDLNLNKIINSGVFILPLGNNRYKVGATYDWDSFELEPTQSATDELTEKLKKFLNAPFTIVNQSVGIRPTIKDRRPLLGTHPKHKSIHIFNGMGSRGVFMVPYLSKMFVDFLLRAKPMHKEADIARFNKLFEN